MEYNIFEKNVREILKELGIAGTFQSDDRIKLDFKQRLDLATKLSDDFGVHINSESLGNDLTVRVIADILRQAMQDQAPGSESSASEITPAEAKHSYVLSYGQERMYVLYKLQPESAFYNINSIVELSGDINVPCLSRSLDKLIKRHEALRANFGEQDGVPVQFVHPEPTTSLRFYDLSELTQRQRAAEKRRVVKQTTQTPFRLESDPLLRVVLVKEVDDPKTPANNRYTLIETLHHIISDGWSMEIFFRDLTEIYNSYILEQDPDLPDITVRYIDYAEWERSIDYEKKMEQEGAYWVQEITDSPPVLNLPLDKSRPPVQTHTGGTEYREVGGNLTFALRESAQKCEVTMFTLLFSLFSAMLYRITGSEDMVLGMPSANRKFSETYNTIGVFVNIIPIRVKLSNDTTFLDLIYQFKTKTVQAMQNEEIPFEYLLKELQPERDASHTPLFNVMFQYDYMPEQEYNFVNTKLESSLYSNNTTKFDLKLGVRELNSGRLSLALEYNKDLFNKSKIIRFLDILIFLIRQTVSCPEQKIREVDILSDKDLCLLGKINNSQKNYGNKSLKTLFEEQVSESPDNIAVEFEGEGVTYEILNQRANQLARFLRGHQNENKVLNLVGVAVDRGINLVVAILAVHKLNCDCLLLNTDIPLKRLNYMLDDSSPDIILVSGKHLGSLGGYARSGQVFNIDEVIKKIESYNACNPGNSAVKGGNHIIYTSGSTGKPKAVLVNEKGIINHILNRVRLMGIQSDYTLCLNLPVGVVPFMAELFGALLVGTKMLLYGNDTIKDPNKLFRRISEDNIDLIVEISASIVDAYLDFARSSKNAYPLNSLKVIGVGAEKLGADTVKRFLRLHPWVKIFYAYGQTECTGMTLSRYYQYSDLGNLRINEGVPVTNTQAYILDDNMKLLPSCIPGELYISGHGIAEQYLNDKEKTQNAFLPHPFRASTFINPDHNLKIYRTGDRAQINDDGSIQVLGRFDHQVSLRGHRIELGEIENTLKKHKDIKDVAVIVRGNAYSKENYQDYLVAYCSLESGRAFDPKGYKKYLLDFLPAFMVPSQFIQLHELPKTGSGKVDRKELPEPARGIGEGFDYAKDYTRTEMHLAKIWKDVLGATKVGRHDSFFDLGGNSLNAMQVHHKIENLFPGRVKFSHLFIYYTIKELAELIDDGGSGKNKNSSERLSEIFSELEKNNISETKAFKDIMDSIN